MSKTATVDIADLLLDYNFYPRHKINSQHSSRLALAIEAGNSVPPIIVDKKTMRVSDGFHRVDAYRKLYGTHAQIPVIFKEYKSDRELFIDAMRYNSDHGYNLTSQDRARSVGIAQSLGIKDEMIAHALRVKVKVITEDYEARKCSVVKITVKEEPKETPKSTTAKAKVKKDTGFTETVYLKRPALWMAGGQLTQEQVAIHEKLGGNPASYYVNQLILLIEGKFIDPSDTQLYSRLSTLRDTLDQYLMRHAA